jgi:hypothetical protein
VPWAICSICQVDNPEEAKRILPDGGSTTGLNRHIDELHPELVEKGKKKDKKQINTLQFSKVS